MSAEDHLQNIKNAIDGSMKVMPGPLKEKKGRFGRYWRTWNLRGGAKEHSDISSEVYHRLLLRTAVLDDLEEIEFQRLNKASGAEAIEHSSGGGPVRRRFLLPPTSAKPPLHERAYHLAVTDLFVEKAQAYLEKEARWYRLVGYTAGFFAVVAILVGVCFSLWNSPLWNPSAPVPTIFQFVEQPAPPPLEREENFTAQSPKVMTPARPAASAEATSGDWYTLIRNFISGFTFYGFIVLFSVVNWRFARALLDQAERLHDRRHALRQGRLIVHLSKDGLGVEDLVKAFNWNVSTQNAFANMPTEASAPWGAAINELIKIIPQVVEGTVSGINKTAAKEKQKEK